MITRRILSLLLCLMFVGGVLSAKTIKGIVLDDSDGEPIIGATVVCKGTNVGVVTDSNGKFSLDVPDGVKTLLVSFVGMEAQEVAVQDNLVVRLKMLDDSMLDEVLVVAFGEQKRSSFTGSAGVVKSDAIKQRPLNDPVQTLAGKIPGVQMNVSSGSPTATPSIQIRGTGSINASNEPLYIVDGAPMVGSSYLINSEDVESITVLKDAASNALYGARGANGVIMITTKKGTQGKAKISFNAKLGVVSRAVQKYDVVTDPRAYYELHYQALYNHNVRYNQLSSYAAHLAANNTLGMNASNGGLGYVTYAVPEGEYLIGANGKMNPNARPGNIVSKDGKEYMVRPDDWEEEAFRTGLRQDYSVNFSGGLQGFNYYATLGYLNNEGILEGSEYERYTFRLKTDWKLRSWLNFGANINYSKAKSNSVSTGSLSVFGIVDQNAPIYPLYLRDAEGNILYDQNGKMYDYGNGAVNGLMRPFAIEANFLQENRLNTNVRDRGILNLAGNLDISVPWVEGLKLQLKSTITQNTSNGTSTEQPWYGSGATSTPHGWVTQDANKTYSYNHQQLLTYIRQFGHHNVNLMLGHEYYRNTYEYLTGSKKNMFSYWGNQTLDGAVTTVPNELGGSKSIYNTEGWLSRAMYDYNDTYFFSASYRRDATSRFDPNFHWGNFYSFGGAWMLTKEEWFPKSKLLNMLKLKASWGQQGNDGIGNFLYTTIYDIINVNDNVGLEMSTVKGVKNITWETNSNFNVGLEFALLNNRLSGEVEYFNRKTTDMLCEIRVPLDAGYAFQYGNVGDMRNAGVEFSLSYDIFRNRDLSWNVYVNGTHYKNRILRLNDGNKGTNLDGHLGYVSGNYFYGEGLSIHSWRLKKFAGVDHATGEALYYKTDKETGEVSTTNDYDNATYYYCGTSDPTLYGGFGTSFSFKGFDLMASFTYSLGGKAYDNMYASFMSNPSAGYTSLNHHKDIYNAWSETNSTSNIPRFQYAVGRSDQTSTSSSDRFLTSSSTLSLQNINIGYTFPKALMRRAGLERLRLFASGDNLCYWSKRKGFDPRNSFWGSPSTTGYSLTRTFTFGVELGF